MNSTEEEIKGRIILGNKTYYANQALFKVNRTIINYNKSQRLGWFGHVYRMPDERMVKKAYEWKPVATRSLGRPKNMWEHDIKMT
jgi:hypothetical protein